MKRLWWVGLVLASTVMLGIWLGPYALSVYHTEAGGRALDAALVPVFSDRLAPEQVISAERLQAGMAHLQEAYRQDPRNAQALRLLARAYLSQGNPQAALEALQQASAVRPENPLLRLELGDVYDALGRTEEAVQAYESGGVGSRGLPLAANYLKLADAKAQAGGGDAAIILWRKALAVDPGNLYALHRLTEAHRAMGDESQAAAYGERLQNFELSSVAVPSDFRLAEYQAQAMAALTESRVWERDTLLNVVSYQVQQFFDSVPGLMTERELQKLLEQWPEDADLLLYLAELYQRRNDLDRAEVVYQQVLAVNPEYAQAYLRLGMVAERKAQSPSPTSQEQLKEAAGWYMKYHEMVPRDLLGFKRLVDVCTALEEMGEEQEGCYRMTGWLEQAGAAQPEYPVGQELDGWTLLGYDVDEVRLIRGEPVDILLYWMGPAPATAGSEQDGWYQAGERWVQVLQGVRNLVPNGGFELGWEYGSPTGFPGDIYGADPGTRQLATDFRAGQRTVVALLDNTEVYSRTSFTSPSMPVNLGALYLQAGWLRSAGGNGYLGRRWIGDIPEGVRYYDYVAAGVTAEDWQHYAGVTQPVTGTVCGQIWLLNYMIVGRAYFDNVLFVEIGQPGQ